MSVSSGYIPRCVKHVSGQAVVRLNGRDHYLGKWRSKEARQAYDRLINEWLAGGRQLADKDASVNELIRAYWNAVGEGLHGGRSHNLKDALRVLRETYGLTPMADFGPKALKVVREKMREKGWSRGYINRQIGWVKQLFRWGAGEELVSGDQVHALWAVPGVRKGAEGYRETEPIKPVALADVEAILPYLPLVIRTMVQLQLLCGCRPAEICRLKTTDLDMSHPDLWLYRPQEHKGQHLGRERIIYFGPKCIELLRPYLRADGKCLFCPAESEEQRNAEKKRNRKTPMTPSARKRKRKAHRVRSWGESYPTTTYRNAIYRACLKAKVEPWAPNRLRHTRGSEVRKQYGLEAAQVYLGHARCDVTQVYAERDTRLGEELARKIG
jgi:integrase